MKLYLVRHGEAVHQSPDALRPLSEAGEREVAQVAAVLHGAGVRVDRIWHSGKLRAEQTASILAGQLRHRTAIEQVSGIAPLDPVTAFARDLDVWQEDTMVVGHLPFLARLVALLLHTATTDEPVTFATGSVACLERTPEDHWVLRWLLSPKLARAVQS
jgi:phosphohistidine phosphatase